MYSLLLALIYIAFISLGLPDSLLGSAWPVIQSEMNVPVSYAGIISMIMAGNTIIASLLSGRLTHRFGAGLVTATGVLITATTLFGFSNATSFWMLCLFAIPYGLGAGTVDAALNNYVALHYASRHMNWLHCFWGVGASISPYIMSYCLTANLGWNRGYHSVSFIQIILTAVLFISIPLWKRRAADESEGVNTAPVLTLAQSLKIKGVKLALVAFFAYCGVEATTYIWASTYLVNYRGIEPNVAARYASLFFIGITAGRFLSGIISDKIGGRNMVRLGIGIAFIGIILVWLPFSIDLIYLNGLVIIGFGCAPVFPALIHATPANFGKGNSQSIIGIQMASAYTGTTLMPPLFGFFANRAGFGFFPLYLFVFAVLLIIMTEKLNRKIITVHDKPE